MSLIKRRHFLQFAGSTLAAMGLSQSELLSQAERYSQAVAQSAPHKWAMLVGINEYSERTGISSLEGCLTDVDLQYNLLVNRFGFNPDNIVKVTDKADYKPNRQTILEVFQKHLVEKAAPGDVVVFHYSGHGARVIDPDPIYNDGLGLNGTIVPNDDFDPDSGVVPDIMGRTLFLLMRSLKTDNVTAILDSCHSGGGLRGNAVVRAVPDADGARLPMPEELAFQRSLLAEMGISPEAFQAERRAGVAKGLGIGSAQLTELSYEAPYESFKAGTFTYLLTRYLWQMPTGVPAKTVRTSLVRSTRAAVAAYSDQLVQVPEFQAAPSSDSLARPIYFTSPTRGTAEAVVTRVADNGQIVFWMGGVSLSVLQLADAEIEFTVLNEDREPVGIIRQTDRSGLRGVGELLSGEALPGMLLRETVVGLPAHPVLKIGVDASLGAEGEIALRLLPEVLMSAQTGRSQLVASLVDSQTPVDYILGRMSEDNRLRLQASELADSLIPPVGTVLLFTSALEPILNTHDAVGESVVDAIARLKRRFKSLLASKVLRAMSDIKSDMAITGTVFAESNPSRSVPIRAAAFEESAVEAQAFESGGDVNIRLKNSMTEAVYVSCLAIDSDGNMTVVYPNDWSAPEDAALIAPDSELLLPRPEDSPVRYQLNLNDDEDASYVELLTLVSTQSLRNSLRGLQEIASSRGNTRSNVALEENQMLSWLDNMLGDVDEISRSARSGEVAADRTAVSGGAIAVYSTLIEVVRAVE